MILLMNVQKMLQSVTKLITEMIGPTEYLREDTIEASPACQRQTFPAIVRLLTPQSFESCSCVSRMNIETSAANLMRVGFTSFNYISASSDRCCQLSRNEID